MSDYSYFGGLVVRYQWRTGELREKCKSCTKKPSSRVIFFFAVNACKFFFAVSRVNYKKKFNFFIFAVRECNFFIFAVSRVNFKKN